MIRTGLLLLLAAIVGVALYVLVPPRQRMLSAPASLARPVRGVIHVHSRRSDGSGSIDDIAAAAARAGLQFVVFTDHGDATRVPDPPQYRAGVLCIDAAEISTDGGHLVALGLPKAPYPLGGEARDVIEDVARLGGFSIAAHPGSPKPGLRWLEWTAPFDGLEWMNGDSEWRDESSWAIARVLFTYPVRGAESLALLLDRPDAVLRRWDVLTRRRRVVTVAAADAHARFGTRGAGEGAQGGFSLHIPTYEQVFRTFSIALPEAHLTGRAPEDAEHVVQQIRQGHVFSSVDALATPALLAFSATSGAARAVGGDAIAPSDAVSLHVETNAPGDARIALLKDGDVVAQGGGPALSFTAGHEPAVYRVEVTLPNTPGVPPVPWILSNPIYVGLPDAGPLPQRPPPSHVVSQYDNGPAPDWTVEHSARSAAALDVVRAVGGTQLAFRYALGGSSADGPYAAATMPAGPAFASSDRLSFTARADKPMRVSVQIRTGGPAAGERWHRSVYLDTTPREVTVFFDEMTPIGVTRTRRPPLELVNRVMWVVDTVNARPGTNGQVWIDDVAYGR